MERSFNQGAVCMQIPYIEPHCDAFHRDPYPTYKLLRLLTPITYWPEGKAWLITRYEDVVAIQQDKRFSARFKDWRGYEHSVQEELIWKSYETEDLHALSVEDNQRLQAAVVSYFVEENSGFLRSMILQICNQKLFRINRRHQFDLISDFARDISVRVVTKLFSIPERYLPLFIEFARAYIELLDPGNSYTHDELQQRIDRLTVGRVLIRDAIRTRRSVSRGQLLIDHLISMRYDGNWLTDTELVSLISILAAESLDMSRLLIANTVFNLLRHNSLAVLQADPALWPNAIREVLRYDYPLKLGTPRYALQECQWGDVTVAQGDMVHPIIASAQRDPQMFSRPDEFDVARPTRQILTWDLSTHPFIGMDLALFEAEVAVRRLFEVQPSLRLVGAPTYDPHHKTLRAITSLPLAVSSHGNR